MKNYKKEFAKLLRKYSNKRAKIRDAQIKNALTPEQLEVLALEESATLEEIIEAIENLPEDSENPEIAALKALVEELRTALAENQEEFEQKIENMLKGATKKEFVNFIAEAVENKLFENATGRTTVAKTHFTNANNTNVNVIYSDTEVGVVPSTVPTLLDYVRQISLGGQNAVAWNEVDGTTENKAAIVAIGDDKPIKTFNHSTTTTGTDTLAVIALLPKQYRAAISIIADIYLNDLSKDLLRKLNAQLVKLIATGSDLADLVETVKTVKSAQLIDAIKYVSSAIKRLYPENRVIVGLTQDALFELDSVKDKNGNYITYDFAQKGIVLVSIPEMSETVNKATTDIFTNTNILAMSEGILRWYNDGIENLVTEERYWEKNSIGLMVEVLNSLFVLRGCDSGATLFDDYETIIEDMTDTELVG